MRVEERLTKGRKKTCTHPGGRNLVWLNLKILRRQLMRKWWSTGIHLFTKVLRVSKPDIVAGVGSGGRGKGWGWGDIMSEGPEGERRSWMEVNREIRHNLYPQRSLVMGAR